MCEKTTMTLREAVKEYMVRECDVDEDGLGPVTGEHIDDQIELGVNFYGSREKLRLVMSKFLGVTVT